MKIAWYTPFCVNSAIGRFSQLVVGALRGLGVEVQLVRSEAKTPALRSGDVVCDDEKWLWANDLNRNVRKHLGPYDLVIYNVGDHYNYHTFCFEHQPIVPGLTILHDYCLHHALYHHAQRAAGIALSYRDQVEQECGPEAGRVYDRFLDNGSPGLWWHHGIAQFPVYRWAVQDTLGIVTHADFYRDIAAARIGCPTTKIPLAYDSPLPFGNATSREPSEKLTILTVGAVNANKRYEAVIRALAESPLLRKRCRYRIVGAADAAQQRMIESALATHTHRPEVHLTGRVSREVLRQEMASADIVSCLRYPALEGASASVVEGLLTGRPVVTCNTGCYQEIPDELVFKVSPDHEHAQLTRAFEEIVTDYPGALRRARAAREWAAARHAPTAYAKQLLDFSQRLLYDRPVLQLVDRIAGHLQNWNVQADPSMLEQVDRAMIDLFRATNPSHRAA